jgi:hypothetical protein
VRQARVAPWEEVAVDLIGRWMIKLGSQELVFNVLTSIVTDTSLTGLITLKIKHLRMSE